MKYQGLVENSLSHMVRSLFGYHKASSVSKNCTRSSSSQKVSLKAIIPHQSIFDQNQRNSKHLF
jgi:hypothetical protein